MREKRNVKGGDWTEVVPRSRGGEVVPSREYYLLLWHCLADPFASFLLRLIRPYPSYPVQSTLR